MAATTPRVTTTQSDNGQTGTRESPVSLDRLQRVSRATRKETTRRSAEQHRFQGRQHTAVNQQQGDQDMADGGHVLCGHQACPFQDAPKIASDLIGGALADGSARNQNQPGRTQQFMLHPTERLAHPSPGQIPDHRPAQRLGGDHSQFGARSFRKLNPVQNQ